VKLLLDNNVSQRLIGLLAKEFPGSVDVRSVGLATASDQAVWDFAKVEGLVIVSKDADFHQMSFLHGPPPKVVWIRQGNCTTEDIAILLRRHAAAIAAFAEDFESAFLAVSG
jgi:predicted nuclease of predicted toxin-antitoxin system